MQVALTIAGSDSGGGAGIQADLRTFHQFGVYGTSAITAVTAQNTLGVLDWHAVTAELVRQQIEAVASDLPPAACKSGMLANSAIIRTVGECMHRFALPNYVLDPVMLATSGDPLIEPDAISAIRTDLLPLTDLVTPNGDEATILTGMRVTDEATMRVAAVALVAMGAKAVLLKGGHLSADEDIVVDLLYDGDFTFFRHERIETTSTHGTGCTLSAAITAQLALGVPLRDAVEISIDFVHAAISSAPGLGSGHGPLNHFAAGSEATNSRTIA